MKKILFTLLLAGVISFAASAQTRVGGHLAYGTEIENLGLGGVGEFFLNREMAIAPSLTFFFPEKYGFYRNSFWEMNINFNYYFVPDGSVNFYGLAGLNFGTVKLRYDGPGNDFSDSHTEIGLNIGMGINFVLQNNKVVPFLEFKYAISDYDQAVFAFGVKVNM